MGEAREDCEVCGGTRRCPPCEGAGLRTFPGPVKIACAECDGSGCCAACRAVAGKGRAVEN